MYVHRTIFSPFVWEYGAPDRDNFLKPNQKLHSRKIFERSLFSPPSSASPLICKEGGEKTKKASKTSSLPPAIVGKKRFSQQGEKEEEDGEEGDQKDAADLMPLVEEEEEDFFPQPFPSHFYFSASGAEKFLLVFPAKPEDIFFRANRFGKRRGAEKKKSVFFLLLPPPSF